MNAIVPIPKVAVAFREATLADMPALDALQKKHNKALGYFPTKQFEGYIAMRGILIAECDSRIVGYCIWRDRYLKRDELGVVYQLCVTSEDQRKLVGAGLVQEAFRRSAYGCKLFCLWCAQDLPANRFWEAMGFVPIAFRAGSRGKRRVHIFWQRRIREGDATTPWWFPSQTTSGSIREDRLVFPIPPGTHWSDAKPIVLPGENTKLIESQTRRAQKPATPILLPPTRRFVQFGAAPTAPPAPAPPAAKPKAEKKPKQKHDPKLIAAARELRDRYLEHVNQDQSALPAPGGKYEVVKHLPPPEAGEPPLLEAA